MYLTFRDCISGRTRGSFQYVFSFNNQAFEYISESLFKIIFKDISNLIFLVSSKKE